jgi:hypothetical protein
MRITGKEDGGLVLYTGSTTGMNSYNLPAPTFELTMSINGNLQSSEIVPTTYSLHQNVHVTMNANGVISATVDNLNCAGTSP